MPVKWRAVRVEASAVLDPVTVRSSHGSSSLRHDTAFHCPQSTQSFLCIPNVQNRQPQARLLFLCITWNSLEKHGGKPMVQRKDCPLPSGNHLPHQLGSQRDPEPQRKDSLAVFLAACTESCPRGRFLSLQQM